ncbi:hypothetical protein Sjap_011939 [Stephania japonica]|uniref:BRCT domain-containing protein n=1 Tax=Stephania japonica TaxID=461633 RepID=A0AAP0P551_9MAGN
MSGGRVEVIDSNGCSRLFSGFSNSLPSFRTLQSFEPMSPASSVASESAARWNGPFANLVICVTGLSKEARKQVMEATERLGGQYSPHLHPHFGGRKLEHALKHGPGNGLSVVTLGWFVDSVRRNVRLSESLYSVKSVADTHLKSSQKSCLPVSLYEDAKKSNVTCQPLLHSSENESGRDLDLALAGHLVYVDPDISDDLKSKVLDAASREGAVIIDHWFVGCAATYVVCEGLHIHRYFGRTNNLVTPLWILKTAKEKCMQRLVHLSADLARQVGAILENFQNAPDAKDMEVGGHHSHTRSQECKNTGKREESLEDRYQTIKLVKEAIRKRRSRQLQTCQAQIRPITPSTLLDSICWSVCDPSETACIYTDFSSLEDSSELHTSVFFDARADGRDSEASFENFSRRLRESEKSEIIFKHHFLTILFPIDRFGEMGPSSRTFVNNNGFTCMQVLEHIHAFYQENISEDEVKIAIHSDSRHADRLRSIYASKESVERGCVQFKRIDFLGSRRSFEMLKRVNGDNNSNVYELLIRA